MHKTKPEWQAGKINGLGGKVEEGEEASTCIQRELKEESGLIIEATAWTHVASLQGPLWVVDVFGATYLGDSTDAKSQEEEKIEWFAVNNLPDNVIDNLRWLIPMTIDKLRHGAFRQGVVEYL